MQSSIVVISWWSNCLGLYAIQKIVEHIPHAKIYVIQTGKQASLKEKFRKFLPYQAHELIYPENESAAHWKVLEYTINHLLKAEEGLWFFDHDTFLMENAENWMRRMDEQLSISKNLICIADRNHYKSLTIPAFWVAPCGLDQSLPSFSPLPEISDIEANNPYIQITKIPELRIPQKDTLELFVEELDVRNNVLKFDLELSFPKHHHLGGLNILRYKNLPNELGNIGLETARRFHDFYKLCPKEWITIEDQTILKSIKTILKKNKTRPNKSGEMIFTKLGNTDLIVSRLGFGTMRLPVVKNNPDIKKAVEILKYAIQKKINFFDVGTFYCYNQCEKVFGETLKETFNNEVVISGKNVTHQHNLPDWTGQLINSLSLFNRLSLDIYFIHYLNYDVWTKRYINEGLIDEVNEAMNKQLFKYLAFSSHDTPANVIKLIDTKYFNAVILSYNLLNRDYEHVIKYAHEQGLGVFIMNPLGGGLLANPQLNLDALIEYLPKSNFVEIALNYVYSNPFVNCVLSGMQNEEEIDSNVDILLNKPRYTIVQINQINKIIEAEKSKQIFYCTNCNYCMPCTQGINIPSVISIMNKYAIKTGKPYFIRDYAVLQQPASCCIACGECEKKCPNKLSISAIMLKAASTFIE